MMVTADHGNAEKMISEHGGPHTAHTTFRGTANICITVLFCWLSSSASLVLVIIMYVLSRARKRKARVLDFMLHMLRSEQLTDLEVFLSCVLLVLLLAG